MQTISGLTVGTTYTLSFYQAAAQQEGFRGATTEQWQVTFGSDTQTSPLMNNADRGVVGWNQVTMTFTATSASQTLTFLALGTPNSLPPFVLLDGISLTGPSAGVPEPSTVMITAMGMVGMVVLGVRRRRRVSASKS